MFFRKGKFLVVGLLYGDEGFHKYVEIMWETNNYKNQ